jgi:hypothetical protein
MGGRSSLHTRFYNIQFPAFQNVVKYADCEHTFPDTLPPSKKDALGRNKN